MFWEFLFIVLLIYVWTGWIRPGLSRIFQYQREEPGTGYRRDTLYILIQEYAVPAARRAYVSCTTLYQGRLQCVVQEYVYEDTKKTLKDTKEDKTKKWKELQYLRAADFAVTDKLDLQGFPEEVALSLLQQCLSDTEKELQPGQRKIVTVMTGRRTQSRDGQPVIKPAVQRFLKHHGYRYQIPNKRTGVFSVTVTGKNSLLKCIQ